MKLNNRLARIERALGRRTDDRIPVICVDASGKRSIAQYSKASGVDYRHDYFQSYNCKTENVRYSKASGVDYRHDLWMVADETQ